MRDSSVRSRPRRDRRIQPASRQGGCRGPLDKTQADGTTIPAEMPGVWLALLDRTRANQDKHARRKPKGISLPRKELRRNRRVGGRRMKITLLVAALIVAVVIVALLLVYHLAATPNQANPAKE